MSSSVYDSMILLLSQFQVELNFAETQLHELFQFLLSN